MSNIPQNLKYSKQHEWILVDGQYALLGITDFAQKSLGDIVFLELLNVGDKVQAGESCGTIESVKAAEELYSPVSGTIAERNEEVLKSPEKINQDPYKNWILKIKDFDPNEVEGLLSASEYQKYLESLEQEG
ncbi:MAG: glycine cleavage system protein GcvH [Leptospiraceae bacterium]|nr:glycine cleavage system protein GcvH [Leptospiraceae bacterium]MDW7974956.1 glycine cleavage system protein GcvH [Leptospiraceae bacterium]